VQTPETRFVRRADGVSIAYQVFGQGMDLMVSPGAASHLDLAWTDPDLARFLRMLGTFARVIIYDKPGTGLSDPIMHMPTLEERRDDIRTLLDAVGLERASLFGYSEGGPACVLFAATDPERVESLGLYGSIPCGSPADDELNSREEVTVQRRFEAVAVDLAAN
jgi:pimeloyl-ACP methyl ester carboxylesterase